MNGFREIWVESQITRGLDQLLIRDLLAPEDIPDKTDDVERDFEVGPTKGAFEWGGSGLTMELQLKGEETQYLNEETARRSGATRETFFLVREKSIIFGVFRDPTVTAMCSEIRHRVTFQLDPNTCHPKTSHSKFVFNSAFDSVKSSDDFARQKLDLTVAVP
ncbi:unnamed protein product [Allacma fusca]|uniref:Uncharacterized protein n=1 Tax=Allacma fusca TaxID=39272 RepID=A0A8J2JUG3_9HEXA|nr:unnamed protein product [Allacma fusca]